MVGMLFEINGRNIGSRYGYYEISMTVLFLRQYILIEFFTLTSDFQFTGNLLHIQHLL